MSDQMVTLSNTGARISRASLDKFQNIDRQVYVAAIGEFESLLSDGVSFQDSWEQSKMKHMPVFIQIYALMLYLNLGDVPVDYKELNRLISAYQDLDVKK